MILGCESSMPYRDSAKVARGYDIKSNREIAELNEGEHPYFLGIVEFDDSGLLFDPGQLKFVLDKLQSTIDNRRSDYDGKIVVVFAHGWDNNAEHDNPNLQYFREILKTIAWYEKENSGPGKPQSKPRFVEGVYLAWRGRSMLQPFHYFTFWNRKDTAHTIGDRAATQTLLRLRNVAYSKKSDSGPPNRFIIVGHSFGGALVYSAVSQLLTYQLQQCQAELSAYPPLLADSVILVNPAFEASRVLPLYQSLNDNSRCSDPPFPKLAIFTSDSDFDTKSLFNLPRFFSIIHNKTMGTSYRQVDNPIRQGYKIDEQDADIRPVGHYDPLVTHFLLPSDNNDLIKDEVRCRLITKWDKSTTQGLAAQQALREKYLIPKHNYLDFNETCLVVANPKYFNLMPGFERNLMPLNKQQLAVFNVKVHEMILDGHGLPDKNRKDNLLTFLGRFIPFSVGDKSF